MKIMHITATHLNKYGGIPVVLENLVKHQNEIQNVESIVLSVKEETNNINSKYFYYSNKIDHIKKFINEYNPDITIFHGLYFIEYIKISKILSRNDFKYFIEPHSSFMISAQKKGKIKKFIANKTIFNTFIKKAYGYIFLNDVEMANSIFKSNNDVIIPNGVETNDLGFGKNVKDIIKLFFIGRIDISHKGLDILFEDLKKIDDQERNFIIDFYGVGAETEIQIIEDYIKQFKNLKLAFKGPVFGEDKEDVYENYNMMILTSRYEGFPMTVLEALSYGNPCIVTEGTNVKQMIERNNLGWGTEYGNISTTILKAVKDYQENNDFYITETKKFVNRNFTWGKIAQKSVEQIFKVMNR
jgi:glycosyltransferase involved in cell wall biosynthesis